MGVFGIVAEEPVVHQVLPEEIPLMLEELKPLIVRAISNPRFTRLTNVESVLMALDQGYMQLWYCLDKNGHGIILTTVVQYPEAKLLEVNYVAGENIETLFMTAYHAMKAFGRRMGCQHLRGFGREGWLKLIPDKPRKHVLWDVDL